MAKMLGPANHANRAAAQETLRMAHYRMTELT
jgi:hypothetical protein